MCFVLLHLLDSSGNFIGRRYEQLENQTVLIYQRAG